MIRAPKIRWILCLATPLASLSSFALEPPNGSAAVVFQSQTGAFEIKYDNGTLLKGRVWIPGHPELESKIRFNSRFSSGNREQITQEISISSPDNHSLHLKAEIVGSSEAFPAETLTTAQTKFKLVRNSVGLSRNLRNNAIYDRQRDWMLEAVAPASVQISPIADTNRARRFFWSESGSQIRLTFRPRYYQKHKNLPYFRPWEYSVWKESVTGWCSWWAYFADVREQDVEKVSEIFSDKLKDFGYRTIQIDDGYQSSGGGLPKDWLQTNARFPKGLQHLSKFISERGLVPALWVNVHFDDEDFVKAHPDFFIQNDQGQPLKGPWIDYGLDGSNPEAIKTVVQPTYHALHEMGWRYIKVDTLRHLLYDASYPSKAYFAKKGVALEDAFRDYLSAIRKELGPQTYMLACWGVLPEVIGIANGCRLGGDGFGPSTLQQYTSWNNVVWRNDPDHCDVKPIDRKTGKYVDDEERIRPVLVSMAGGQLLLSDKPEVYENDANLEGVKRSSPILFTVPGQLYDYDPIKTNHLKDGLRNDHGGANSGPIDADQKGAVCPWWMLDINQPYESWTVLSHLNWSTEQMPQATVRFTDLGLAAETYSVYEFWSKKYLGDFKDSFVTDPLVPKGVATYSIRQTLNHPQILSTSRHISQGGVDLNKVTWKINTLSGTSNVVRNDPYSIAIRIPDGFSIHKAMIDGHPAQIKMASKLATISMVPSRTGTVQWSVVF